MRHRAVMKFKLGPAAVGMKVAKDFTNGVWFGEATKCDDEPDEDGDDVDGGIYTILHADGDGGDWEEHECTYGANLCMVMNPKKAKGCEAAGNVVSPQGKGMREGDLSALAALKGRALFTSVPLIRVRAPGPDVFVWAN